MRLRLEANLGLGCDFCTSLLEEKLWLARAGHPWCQFRAVEGPGAAIPAPLLREFLACWDRRCHTLGQCRTCSGRSSGRGPVLHAAAVSAAAPCASASCSTCGGWGFTAQAALCTTGSSAAPGSAAFSAQGQTLQACTVDPGERFRAAAAVNGVCTLHPLLRAPTHLPHLRCRLQVPRCQKASRP